MNLFDISFRFAKAGLMLTEKTVSGLQTALERIAGIERDSSMLPPVDGPRDLDHALSEFANRTFRILHFTPFAPDAIATAIEEWLLAAKFSFGFIRWKDRHSLVLPLLAPLSIATLGMQA